MLHHLKHAPQWAGRGAYRFQSRINGIVKLPSILRKSDRSHSKNSIRNSEATHHSLFMDEPCCRSGGLDVISTNSVTLPISRTESEALSL